MIFSYCVCKKIKMALVCFDFVVIKCEYVNRLIKEKREDDDDIDREDNDDLDPDETEVSNPLYIYFDEKVFKDTETNVDDVVEVISKLRVGDDYIVFKSIEDPMQVIEHLKDTDFCEIYSISSFKAYNTKLGQFAVIELGCESG